jgi:MerR family transcriptional regulator, thiopeptide resistance regulator
MSYTIKQLANLAGVSVRTLHYYDEIGLLKPQSVGNNGYRSYAQQEMIRLQQILFFKELDFSLAEIRSIMENQNFDMANALQLHRKLLIKKVGRIKSLIRTIDKTVMNLRGELKMNENEYYQGFSKEKQEKYEQEIIRNYGRKSLDESKARVQKWSKEDFNKTTQESEKIFTAIRDNMSRGFDSTEVQSQIKELHKWLNKFYSCDLEMFRSLGHLYNEHPDFIKMYQTRYHVDMPDFLLKAIEYYAFNST